MSTCKDCRHWGMAWPNPDLNKRNCNVLSNMDGDEPEGMIDDDGTTRMFYTGPDFGCVHFEAKGGPEEEGDDADTELEPPQ